MHISRRQILSRNAYAQHEPQAPKGGIRGWNSRIREVRLLIPWDICGTTSHFNLTITEENGTGDKREAHRKARRQRAQHGEPQRPLTRHLMYTFRFRRMCQATKDQSVRCTPEDIRYDR